MLIGYGYFILTRTIAARNGNCSLKKEPANDDDKDEGECVVHVGREFSRLPCDRATVRLMEDGRVQLEGLHKTFFIVASISFHFRFVYNVHHVVAHCYNIHALFGQISGDAISHVERGENGFNYLSLIFREVLKEFFVLQGLYKLFGIVKTGGYFAFVEQDRFFAHIKRVKLALRSIGSGFRVTRAKGDLISAILTRHALYGECLAQ